VGDPGAALLVGALLWALVSVVVATESAKLGMRRHAWGWAASFLVASLVAAYSFGRFV
jgi:enoyl-CoA hydratase/carnithine racemase